MSVAAMGMVLVFWSAVVGAHQLHASVSSGGSWLLGGLVGLSFDSKVHGQHVNDVTALDVSFDPEELTEWSDEYTCQPNR